MGVMTRTPCGLLWLVASPMWRDGGRPAALINSLELKAYLLEEKRVCISHKSCRFLSGLDSQVCLGALIKGRSSSPSLNRLLRSNLCYPLGASIFNYHMYYPSERNRADGPTRHALPAPPELEEPAWMNSLREGKVEEFDAWMASLPKIDTKSDLDFEALLNGKCVDLRPASRLSPSQRRKEKLSAAATADLPPFENEDAPVSTLCAEAVEILMTFNENQIFRFRPKESKGFTEPGGLDLFSGCCGVAKQMILAGAPWVVTFEWSRSSSEDLLDETVRDKIRRLLLFGAVLTLGLAPICASFSTAITPAVRS